jgi:protein-disulfide isomerase
MKLLKNIEKGTSNEKGNIEVTLLEDEKYLSKYGISNTPALVINDKVISQGKILTEKEIKHYLKILS